MSPVQNWGGAVSFSLISLWERFIGFVPALVGAILVFFIGLVVAAALGKFAEKIFSTLRFDKAAEKLRLPDYFGKAGVQVKISKFFGELIKWFLVLVFLMAATDILKLDQVSGFLNSVILYIPNIVIATIILSVTFLFANFVYHAVRSSTKIAGVMSASLLATLIKWSVIIFGILAALIQLGIAVSLVNTIFIGLVAALSLAIGLAFGLGGKEEAAMMLRKIREDITNK